MPTISLGPLPDKCPECGRGKLAVHRQLKPCLVGEASCCLRIRMIQRVQEYFRRERGIKLNAGDAHEVIVRAARLASVEA